jgi:parallel beta helix pectate lyase-like protein
MTIRQLAGVIASVVPLVACGEPQRDPPDSRAESVEMAAATAVPTTPRPGLRYYVDPRGSDQASGGKAAPFRTIQRAADQAGPGDTVIVRAGVYSGSERIVSIHRGGEPSRWITFQSEQKWEAVLDGREESLEGWYFGPGVGYVQVVGFEVRNLREHGFDTYGGSVHDLLIARNHVHHIGRNCTDTSNGRTGASLGAGTQGVTFDANVWHDIGRLAPGENGCSPKTEYYQNHDHGIYVADADDVTIINNVFYNFSRGWAIHRYFSRGSPSHGLRILNNTFAGRNPYRAGQIILATPTAGLRIENNIFYAPETAALYFEDLRFPDASVRYNMVFDGVIKVGRPQGVAFGRNWERTDPRFSGTTDFRLRSDSRAIDVGLSLPEVARDADGVTRPRGQGYDLGAYER